MTVHALWAKNNASGSDYKYFDRLGHLRFLTHIWKTCCRQYLKFNDLLSLWASIAPLHQLLG